MCAGVCAKKKPAIRLKLFFLALLVSFLLKFQILNNEVVMGMCLINNSLTCSLNEFSCSPSPSITGQPSDFSPFIRLCMPIFGMVCGGGWFFQGVRLLSAAPEGETGSAHRERGTRTCTFLFLGGTTVAISLIFLRCFNSQIS